MSTNDPPQGPYGQGSWPPQNPSGDPGWPPQQPAQQPPPPPNQGGWPEQRTTQWPAQQPSDTQSYPGSGPGTGGPYGAPPSAPPGPYGAPPGSPPGGPPYYPPPSRSGSSGGAKTTLWIVGGVAALVLVLIVAIVGIIAVRSGDPTPSAPRAGGKGAKAGTKVLWELPDPPGSDIKGANTLSGLWLSDKTIVRATVLGLTAYDLDTGKQQWSRPMASGTSVCQLTPEAVDGVGAVIYGATLSTGAKCDQLMAVDATSGAQRWTISLKQPGDRIRQFSDSFTSVSIASDNVIAQNSDAVRAYAISDGARRWGLVPKGGASSNCKAINSMAEDDRVIVVLDCLSSRGSISLADAVTGKLLWTHETASTEGDPLFMDPLSVKPAVLVSKTLGGRTQMLVLDNDSGSLQQQISSSIGGSSALDFSTDGSRLDGQVFYHAAVNDGKLFAATQGASGARRNEVVAVDLSTGEAVWTTPAATNTRETVIKVDDDGVLALNQGTFETLPRLVRYDAATGKGTNGVTLPESLRNKLVRVTTFVQGNKIVLVSTRAGPDQPPITVLGE